MDNTQRVFETALVSAEDGTRALLVGTDGALRVVCDSDWAPDALAREYGAQEMYFVTRRAGTVRVEANAGLSRCVLQSEPYASTARRLLSGGLGASSCQISRRGTSPASPAPCQMGKHAFT